MGLEAILRFGYILVIVTILLMILTSLARASPREIEQKQYPPCAYNPLCTCSKSSMDLGIVYCKDVPFPALPKMVNNSKVFMLHMENTGLREIEPYFLQATGMYRLKIANSYLTEISDDAFAGLERSLWELLLPHNDLVDIPSKSFRHLQKLRHLDLSYNHITAIGHDSFRGLEESLQMLILKENCISMLPAHAFGGLLNLETLDLSGNNLYEIDPSVFKDGMPRLTRLLLTDNILSEIPYDAIGTLKMLRTLDISHNIITSLAGNESTGARVSSVKLNLDNLHLEYNHIHKLASNSFRNFDVVNRTFFDGNPIYALMEDAFKPAKIREIYMRYCGLTHISPVAFDSLVNTLQILDLSGNNLTNLPEKLFNKFDFLRVLSLRDNQIKIASPVEMFNVFQYTLLKLDLSGEKNSQTNLQELRNMTRMRNIRSLSVSKMNTPALTSNEFLEFGGELEDLQITRGGLTSIQSHTFEHVRAVKRLDLSENSIGTIENDAFTEIGHSLISLKVSHGFTGSSLPSDALRHLTSLQELDFSNNKISSMSDTSFHFLKNLRLLELHDNRIEQVMKGTFQGDIHSKLEEISFKYNNLQQISQHTFFDLEALQKLYLDDNQIGKVERRAFMNLDQLEHLSLRGNKLNSLAEESFQNLPKLQILDMAYNSLPRFGFDYFDQVGTLSSLHVNVSHNMIKTLANNSTWPGRSEHGMMYHSNIKVLDLSHNNISMIQSGYFRPAEVSLTHLYVGHNSLMNVTRDIFGNMPHLHWLDLSHNLVKEVDFDAFKNTKKLQVLYLSNNHLTDLPPDLFKPLHQLRVIDLSHNMLKSLPDNIFYNGGFEKMDMSHNHLLKIPISSLSSLAALTLCELNLSHNMIATIHSMDLSNKFRSLKFLDISYNHLLRIDDAVFATLPKIAVLDLSHNRDLKVMEKSFMGLENSLLKLGLENVSLSTVPEFHLQHLRELRLASNELPSIPQELAANMTNLRVLDLSHNDLTNVPLITQHLPNLRALKLSGNPITSLTNNSFDGVTEDLEILEISHFKLKFFEYGSLESLQNLRLLRISSYAYLLDFNIPRLLENHHNIRELWIDSPRLMEVNPQNPPKETELQMNKPTDLGREMKGHLPSKLKKIAFSGVGFTTLADNILQGIKSPYLHVILYNTSLQEFPPQFFKHLGRVRNISIDVRHHNPQMQKIPNPNSGRVPYLPHSVFLTDLKISKTSLNCDCSLGWVEFWQRKRRQYICSSQTWTDTVFRTFMNSPCQVYGKHNCDERDDDLREAKCSNKNYEPLLEILKSDLECGWDRASTTFSMTLSIVITSVLLLFWF